MIFFPDRRKVQEMKNNIYYLKKKIIVSGLRLLLIFLMKIFMKENACIYYC